MLPIDLLDRPLSLVEGFRLALPKRRRQSVRSPSYPDPHVQPPVPDRPARVDIDLRLADLWREAAGISEWSLDVVAAFMRAAYGKGYCDALTEDAPGSLCADHGYRVPVRKRTAV